MAEEESEYPDEGYILAQLGEDQEPIVVEPYIRVLNKEEAQLRLRMLGRTDCGDTYAYVKIEAVQMKLTNIDVIVEFKYLLFVNVSSNFLTLNDLQILKNLPCLVLLHADFNHITSLDLKVMEYLQVLIMNNNQIMTCAGLHQPLLSCLELGFNNITEITFDIPPSELEILDLRNNHIVSTRGICFPKLHTLYLAGNRIEELVELDLLVNLRVLHLRGNPIRKLNGFSAAMTKLIYVNMRKCKINNMREIKKLKVLPALEVFIVKGCPVMTGVEEGTTTEDEDDDDGGEDEDNSTIRIEIIARLPTILRLNKQPVLQEERDEAMELMATIDEDEQKEDNEEF